MQMFMTLQNSVLAVVELVHFHMFVLYICILTLWNSVCVLKITLINFYIVWICHSHLASQIWQQEALLSQTNCTKLHCEQSLHSRRSTIEITNRMTYYISQGRVETPVRRDRRLFQYQSAKNYQNAMFRKKPTYVFLHNS